MSNRSIALTLKAVALAAAIGVITGCATAPEPLPLTRPEDKSVSPVVREALPEPVVAAPGAGSIAPPAADTSAAAATAGAASSTPMPPTTTAAASAEPPATTTPAPSATLSPGNRKPSKGAPGSTKQAKSAKSPPKPAVAKKDANRNAKIAPSSSDAPTLASAAPSSSAPAAGVASDAGAAAGSTQASIPPGTLYICSAVVNGSAQQTAIEFEPQVKTLCARHPEMGVCQYEREQCRAAGGRVYTPAGDEITRRTEAEYDKKVLRVRFKAG